MFLLCVFVYFCVIGQYECSRLNGKYNELRHAEWECDAVCVGSGGKAAFDLKNKICKCAMDKNTDDVELQLISKNADLLGTPLEITKSIVKRQANSNTPQENILGQRFPQRVNTPRTTLRSTTRRPFQFSSGRIIPTASAFTTPRMNLNVQERLQEIQKRIEERRRSMSRNRTVPHLQQRAGFEEESRPNLMERLKQIQKGMQEKQRSRTAASTSAAPNVAAPAPRFNIDYSDTAIVGASRGVTGNTSPAIETINGKNSNIELITQDPSLYSKED